MLTNKNYTRYLATMAVGVAGFVGILPIAMPAKAQSARLEEILVTAQRREETVQNAALSIQAISGDKLRELGVSRAEDLMQIVPGVQISGGATTQIYVRGVGDFGVLLTANPAVATSLNGVGIARPQAISGNFFDLSRIEFLKGPQGTLYGRNAIGGALNLVPVRPELRETSGFIEGTVGNYGLASSEGAINTPLSKNVAARLSYQVTDRDGYMNDGSEDDEHTSVRLQIYAEPTEKLDMRFDLTHTNLGGVGTGHALLPSIPGADPWTGSASTEASAYYLGLATENFSASGGASIPPFLLDPHDQSKLFQDIKSSSISAELNYDLGFAFLTVIPSYRDTDIKFGTQYTFLYSLGGATSEGETSEQSSLEVRLAGENDNVNWVAGVYGFKEDQSSEFFVNSGLVQRFKVASDLETDVLAVFGQATYNINEKTRITAGIRSSSDERIIKNLRKTAISPTVLETDLSDGIPDDDPCIFAPGTECDLLGGAPLNAFDSDEKFNKITYKFVGEYDITPDNMVYVSVATGFKSGGFNQAIDPRDRTKLLSFAPEELTAYTLGSKNIFFDGSVKLNVEAFYWEYEELQLSRLILDGLGQVALTTQNAGLTEMKGLNVEFEGALWDGGVINVVAEYLDADYKEFSFTQAAALTSPLTTGCAIGPSNLPAGPLGPFATIDCSGFQLLRAPEFSGNIGLRQDFDLNSGGVITFSADVNFASERFTNTGFTKNSKADSYTTLSSSLTYTAANEAWFFSLWGRNLTEDEVYSGGVQSPFVPNYVTSTIGAPRTYGVRTGVSF